MSKATRPLVIIPIALVAIILCGAPAVGLLGAAGLALDLYPHGELYPYGISWPGALAVWAAACAVGVGLLVLGLYLFSCRWKLKSKVLSASVLVQLLIVASMAVVGVVILLFSSGQVLLTVLLPWL